MESQGSRPATVADVHALALAMPHVTVVDGSQGKPVYQVGGKSFIFFRNPRPDAADPVTGERYDDVIVFWVESEADKQSLIDDPGTPFFTTASLRRSPVGPDPRTGPARPQPPRTVRGHPGRLAVPCLRPPRHRMAEIPRPGTGRVILRPVQSDRKSDTAGPR